MPFVQLWLYKNLPAMEPGPSIGGFVASEMPVGVMCNHIIPLK